jgi:hypothetical protein
MQMRLCAVLGFISLISGCAWAQQAPPQVESPAPASSPAMAQPPKTVVPMEEPQPGDHWTYEVRDEITGKISAIRTHLITEVTPTEISARVDDTPEKSESGRIIFDRSWNVTTSGYWRYSPNDGSGIQLPLAVGKTWSVQCSEVNSSTGKIRKRSGSSKVIAQESVTTKAGTFETYKIEMTYITRSVKELARTNDVTYQIWWAPAIDHWVKRTFVSRVDKHLAYNNTIELIDYGRKQ